MKHPKKVKMTGQKKRAVRVRNKIHGTPERPRLSVNRSLKHISAQLIDDDNSVSLLGVSSDSKDFRDKKIDGAKKGLAKEVGKMIAEKAKEKGVTSVVFDRGGYLFVDVREPNETAMGTVPGATLVPRGLLEFRFPSAVEDQDAKIVVYCKSGGRSSLATYTLMHMGYKNVVSMDGGWSAWEEAGYPVE